MEENQQRPWTMGSAVFLGLFLAIPLAPAGLLVPLAFDDDAGWQWVLLTPVWSVSLMVAGTLVAKIGKERGTGMRIVGSVGWLAGVALCLAVLVFAIVSMANIDTCDPEQVRCDLVVNGENRGETDTSVGSQVFSGVLIRLAFIVPAVVGLIMLVRVAVKAGRRR